MYCRKCVLPDTRPNLRLDEGVCGPCRVHAARAAVDWKERERAFRRIAQAAKSRRRGYDCLVPVSGGKDSHWQVIRCLEVGLTPLAVTWKTPARTAVGRENLENLVRLGVDHIDYQINPNVEKKFMVEALLKYGSTAIPMHLALFNIPLKVALRFDIPLVVWGENSALEYGSGAPPDGGLRMDGRWLRQYGVAHGTTARDWVSGTLSEKELTPYFGPSEEALEKAGISAVFLGHFFPWDPETSLRVAREHGFKPSAEGPKTGFYDYADIDDDFISIHHYLKWYKFGFTRLFDNLSLEIRNGRMSRERAIDIIRARGEEVPRGDIARFCEFTGMEPSHFYEEIGKFRNPAVWKRKNRVWVIEDFLVPDWKWSEENAVAAAVQE